MRKENFYIGYNTNNKQFLLLKTGFNWKYLSKNPESIYDVKFIYDDPVWYVRGLDNIKEYLNNEGMNIDITKYINIEPMCLINCDS